MTRPNPILPGFHPDPSICRAGDELFLVTSTFTWFPGVPIFRSTDLLSWEPIGHVLDRPSQLDLSSTDSWTSLGVFAPTLRHHDGRFWMITTNVTDAGAQNFFVTAEDPAGPWSDPIPVDVAGIDPDLAWDGDGTCWVHHSRGPEGIARVPIDDRTGEVLGPVEPTWSGTGGKYPEAPHLYERDGSWYLLIAEGGTGSGHAVSVARGPSPTGPWEGCPANPILTHRGTDHPIRNTGHADLVEGPDGTWWMVLLGVRPTGVGEGFHGLGRETFLTPVEWVDGWPVPAPLDLGPIDSGPPERDDFAGPGLDPRWIALRQEPQAVVSLDRESGGLVLHGTGAGLDDPRPALLARRQQHHHCRARLRIDPGPATEAGLAVYLEADAHFEVCVVGDRIIARGRSGPFTHLADAPAPPGPVVLVVETAPHHHGPDLVRLGHEDGDGGFRVLAELDGRYLSTEVVGGFLGRVIGPYAVGGDAEVDWFEYEGRP